MTADLTKNVLSGKEVKVPQDDVSVRGEKLAFMEGVCWVTAQLFESARRIRPDQRGTVTVDGKPPVEAILKSGNPAFAAHLEALAETIEIEGFKEAQKRFPNFEPTPEPMKRGESTGF
jgi:hypothetical protein